MAGFRPAGHGHCCLILVVLALLLKLSQSGVVDERSSRVESEGPLANARVAKRSTNQRYSWVFGSWTSCSQQCGTGYQLRAVSCIEDVTGDPVSPELCPQNEVPARNRTCAGTSCQAYEFKWIEGQWGDCSVDCGIGEQTQTMLCIQTTVTGHSSYATDDACLQYVGLKPVFTRACNGESDKCPYWATGSWSECSVTCGVGIQTCSLYCQRDPIDATQDPIVLDDPLCPIESKPQQVQICSLEPCLDGANSQLKASEQLELDRNVASCRASLFGCCPDNRTPAKGSSFFGCSDQDPCQLPSDTGPCANHVVKWYFDATVQACTRFWYGGCDGNANRFDDGDACKARCVKKDPREENKVVRCHDSQHGCCEDGVTTAQGPRRAGCPELNRRRSCSESRYGCCTDGSTAAGGPNYEGCPPRTLKGGCAGTRYGCCRDGLTAARGQDGLGCAENQDRCRTSLYGCCQDRVTVATGPNKEGCPEASTQAPTGCLQSAYGCCSDQVSFAHGPNGQGCPSSGLGKTDQTIQATCEQPKHAGTCRDYVIQWYFDAQSKSCRQFYYGGCEGNLNRFSSREECEAKCATPAEPDPHSKPSQTDCAQSEYGCCPDRRTTARGTNYDGCQTKCEDSRYGCCFDGVTPAEGPNQENCDFGSGYTPCNQTPHGCCADGMTAATGPSKRGCGNPPDAEETITSVHRNVESKTPTVSLEKCTAPVSREQCTEFVTKWRFDGQRQECARHWWGGCQDNGNVFESKEACQAECINIVPKVEEKCTAPESREVCKEYAKKWRFDSGSQKCVPHWWGGCQDNGNVFESQGDCEAQCMNTVVLVNPEAEDPDFVNICDMPRDPGPCTDQLVRHYYDPKDRRCRAFYYGGCQGNENNFVNLEDCQRECMLADGKPGSWSPSQGPEHEVVKSTTEQLPVAATERTITHDPAVVCLMSAETGVCRASIDRWFYDHSTGSCSQFVYGGCGGNRNNFENIEECNNYCSSQEVCRQPKTSGPCYAAIPRFFYDSQTDSCQYFVYGGCQGNLNNFASKEACTRKCSRQKPARAGSNVDISGGGTVEDVCKLDPEKGTCRGYDILWYYHTERMACLRFVYTGCDGNGNRFETEKDCTDRCLGRGGGTGRESVSEPAQTTGLSSVHPTDHGSSRVTDQPRTSAGHHLVHAAPGVDALLRCSLRGHHLLWYHDGSLLSSNSRFYISDNGTLTLRRVTEDLAGVYACKVSGENHVEKFKVEVTVPLRIVPGPTLINIRPGEKALFHCQVVGSPEPRVYWTRSGNVLAISDHYNVFGNGTLIINAVSVRDAGDYECVAENGVAATVRRKIVLNIKETFSVDIQRHQGTFTEGETIHLLCKGLGYPPPQVEWMKEGNVVVSNERITADRGELTIKAASIEDAGMYKCFASNGKDKVEDITAVQIVYPNLQVQCVDSMARTKCQLIVSGRLCGLRIFAGKCCQSCKMAGFF